MKKFALMLVMALPFVFASCGDDKDEPSQPTNNNFTIPVLDWNASQATVKGKVKGLSLDIENAETLAYTTNGAYPFYIYAFENDKLEASSLAVSVEMDEEKDLMGFLEERYVLVEEDEEDFIYADASNYEDATVAVVYGLDAENDQVVATWVPVDHSRGGAVVNTYFHNKHLGVARELAK